VTMNVQLVEPEGELWGGRAEMIIARTLDGEIGLLTNHAPIIGILYEGSTVQIRPENGNGADIFAAVTGGFLSMANNRVSILARQAQLGQDVDPVAARRPWTRRSRTPVRRPTPRRSQRTFATTGPCSARRPARSADRLRRGPGDKRECQGS